MSSRTVAGSTLGPLTFQPIYRRARWGGTRLASLLDKDSRHLDDCSESWEIVDLDDHQSTVDSGPFCNWTLRRLVEEHPADLLGRHAPLDAFPLLLKFLDATDRLSLQVHPDDLVAARHHPGLRGKTEAWVVLAAEPASRLWVGLKPGTTAEQLTAALDSGDIDSCVPSFSAQSGQCVIVPAGTVHAIGEGIVLAEIQQASDLTYRLYDWGRLDPNGTPRTIDLQRGLEAVDFDAGPIAPSSPPAANSTHQVTRVERPEFRVVQHQVHGHHELVNDNRCRILTTIAGNGSLEAAGSRHTLAPGRTVLLPASVASAQLHSSDGLTLLDSHLP
jgi:mannose-6-phosphate isomerase